MKYAVNLISLINAFDTDVECRSYLEGLRWPKGVICPRCQSNKISRIKERRQYDCDGCRYQFSVTAGSIFHDSHLPLPKWFLAIYFMCESKKGISANQLKRTIGVSYKTAWYLCHRIRAAMKELNQAPLSGTIEVDETYIGGHRRFVGKGYKGNKSMVLGMVQRGGPIRLQVDKRNDRKTLHRFINENAPNPERVMTDEWQAYRGIEDSDTTHEVVAHAKEEWVRGDVHTNSVEGVWSLFKRSIVGSFHQVSGKHLDSYLDEFEWRFNNRKNHYLFRDTITKLVNAESLPYQTLTA